MNNPDGIIYGFAIGDSGSEKSKVVVDTAYSLLLLINPMKPLPSTHPMNIEPCRKKEK